MKRNRKKEQPTKPSVYSERQHRVADLAEHSVAIRKLQERFPDALTVVDATQDKMLLVTDADVARGEPKNPAACAVAQCAIRQGLGGMIGRQYAYLVEGTHVTRYHLGKDAQVRTAMFDDRGTMNSGPVVLSVPAKCHRLGVMGQRMKEHRTKAKQNPIPKSGTARRRRQIDESIRKSVFSYGFRSWDRA